MSTHIVVFVKSYKSRKKIVQVLREVEDLFSWYQSLIKKIKPVSDNNLFELTNQIIEGANTEKEKARRIFYWVQDNIRYIAIEDGWRGFIPYPASEICNKRYGDCKDMTHLMYEMMKIAKVKAEHAWVGTRRLPYKYEETPCPSVDNHLVLCLKIGGEFLVLDATDSHTPFGIPSSFILGKEILFKSKDGVKLYKIPEYKSENCVIENETFISTNQDKIIGNSSKLIESFEYSSFHNGYGNSNVNKKQFLLEYLELGHNNFQLKNSNINEVVPRSKTKIDFDFEIPNYIPNFDNTFYINLNLTKPFIKNIIKNDRINDYKIDYKHTIKSSVKLKIPEGKKVIKLPKLINIKSEFGTFKAEYIMEGENVIYNRTITLEKLVIKSDEFEKWNDFLKELSKIYNTTIEYK